MSRQGLFGLILVLAACHPPAAETSRTHASCDKTFDYDFKGDKQYAGYTACSESQYPSFEKDEARWTGFYPEHCAGVVGEDAYACGEQIFWQALQLDIEHRFDLYTDLKSLTDEAEARGDLDTYRLAHLHWRVGQLGVAIVTEQGDLSPGLDLDDQFTRAYELVPNKILIEAWMRTVRLNASVILGGDVKKAMDELMVTYEKDHTLVGATVMGAAAGFAKNTGWPEFAVKQVDGMDQNSCGGEFCDTPLNRAPYTFSGLYYEFAEVYARMGYRTKAEHWLKESLLVKNAETWPYRKDAEAALHDVDGFIAKFAARGDDKSVSDLMIGASSGACMLCHTPLR